MAANHPGKENRTLPPRLDTYAELGVRGLFAGVTLALAALFTNPVPDPSFPWFTLPAYLRLPFRQPLIEHWPVSYTIGIWMIVFCFPALFLWGYKRFGRKTEERAGLWLIAGPVLAMFAWTGYCRFFWPKLEPPTWNAPSYTVACWLYCSSYDPFWSNLAFAIAGFGVLAGILAYRGMRGGTLLLALFGVLAFPLGIPALYEAWRRSAA